MMTNYKCYRCENFETPRFFDMKKHFNRKYCCKKLEYKIFFSDDQILCLSIIPYTNNIHNIDEIETQHLEKSNLIDYASMDIMDLKNPERESVKYKKFLLDN